MNGSILVGVISDTHNHFDPRIADFFAEQDVSAIVHAGDICSIHILDRLESIAPTTAVAGNNDFAFSAWSLPRINHLEIGDIRIGLTHRLQDYPHDLNQIDVLVYGHTHRPSITRHPHSDTLLINPGSPSFPRGSYDPSVALLRIDSQMASAALHFFEH